MLRHFCLQSSAKKKKAASDDEDDEDEPLAKKKKPAAKVRSAELGQPCGQLAVVVSFGTHVTACSSSPRAWLQPASAAKKKPEGEATPAKPAKARAPADLLTHRAGSPLSCFSYLGGIVLCLTPHRYACHIETISDCARRRRRPASARCMTSRARSATLRQRCLAQPPNR